MAIALALRSLRPPSPSVLPRQHAIRRFHLSPPRAVLYSRADRATFDKALSEKDRIVVVDFYADWCGPCHLLAPVLQKAIVERKVSGSGLPLDLVKINTEDDDGFELAQTYKVRALPTVIAFKNGKQVSQFVGAQPEGGVQGFLDAV